MLIGYHRKSNSRPTRRTDRSGTVMASVVLRMRQPNILKRENLLIVKNIFIRFIRSEFLIAVNIKVHNLLACDAV